MHNIAPITLNDEHFWDWMIPQEPNGGIYAYIKPFATNQLDSGYLLESLNEDSIQGPSRIMENLDRCMPREYFLEIQYCAKTYATMFSKVFPPLASHVDQLAYIEWLLYTETDNLNYRDHLVHMFKVAFAGDQLLSHSSIVEIMLNKQFRSEHFQRWCENWKIDIKRWGDDDRVKIIKLAFFLAALYHDIGYGYFFMQKYKKRLFKVNKWLLPDADPTDINADNTRFLLQSLSGLFIEKYHNWNCPKTFRNSKAYYSWIFP